MEEGSVERRRGRRVSLEAPIHIRRLDAQQSGSVKEEVTKNVSLAGVYFETEHEQSYAVNDVITTSVAVPESKRREFPFTRLAGRSRVVRVSQLLSKARTGPKRVGIALEFGDDLTALSATPARG